MIPIDITNSKNKRIKAIFKPGPIPTPIIFSHSFSGTKEENGRFEEISKIINREGYPTLQFDFTGCGESDFELVSHETEKEDLLSVTKFLESQGYKHFGLIGRSMGGLITSKIFQEEEMNDKIKTLILWSAVSQSMEPYWEKNFPKEIIEKLKNEGQLTIPTPKNDFQKSFTISSDILKESKEINQKELLSKIHCPVLLIHGDEDEIVPISQSIEAIQYLNEESELVTLKGADHGCKNHISEIGDIIVDWLNQYTST